MRIYVGTFYSGENEFGDCVESVELQRHKDFKHFIFGSVPKNECFPTLFKEFKDSGFDILIKVDADTIIYQKDFFEFIEAQFKLKPHVKQIQTVLFDFFSNQLIWGLNAYRYGRWEFKDDVFTDWTGVEKQFVLSNMKPTAGLHCNNPNKFQAFHYGIHKAVKILYGTGNRVLYNKDVARKTFENFLMNLDVRLGLCALGTKFGIANKVKPRHLNYSDPFAKSIFKRFENYDRHQIFATLRQDWR